MGQTGEIKIRTIPRSNEKTKTKESAEPKKPRLIIYVGTVAIVLLAGALVLPKKTAVPRRAVAEVTPNSLIQESVQRHLQDSEIKHAMMRHQRELENEPFKDALQEPNRDDITELPDTRNYGVQMDSDESSERVYEDLHGEPVHYSDFLPSDKINARLATRKWVNEQEREERVQFVSNFIRSAYDKGYEVEIDQNLVVVGVKRVPHDKKLNINQVMDRLAKQGL